MRSRPTLLFVAPIMPAATGNGLAMRAGVFLDALAHDFAVTLLVVPVAGLGPGSLSPYVSERSQRTVTLSLDGTLDPLWALVERVAEPEARAAAIASYPRPALCRNATRQCLDAAARTFAGARFDAVHVMRSYMAPYAERFLPGGSGSAAAFSSLDLDDDEAATHRRLAALALRAGAAREARMAAAEAAKFARHEETWLPRFQLLIACTRAQAEKVAATGDGIDSAVVPNTVALPAVPHRPPRPGRRLLFVGNLSYLPNVDGICNFVREVMPRLRTLRSDDILLRIAGSAPAPVVVALAALPGVELIVNPVDLASSYAWADLVVIPLSAGGGTRIKLLEAFAHGVPVVATGIGAEGIAAQHGTHLLLADTPEAFAGACALVLSDSALGAHLAKAARGLVESTYSHAVGVRAIRTAFARALPA